MDMCPQNIFKLKGDAKFTFNTVSDKTRECEIKYAEKPKIIGVLRCYEKQQHTYTRTQIMSEADRSRPSNRNTDRSRGNGHMCLARGSRAHTFASASGGMGSRTPQTQQWA